MVSMDRSIWTRVRTCVQAPLAWPFFFFLPLALSFAFFVVLYIFSCFCFIFFHTLIFVTFFFSQALIYVDVVRLAHKLLVITIGRLFVELWVWMDYLENDGLYMDGRKTRITLDPRYVHFYFKSLFCYYYSSILVGGLSFIIELGA